jgi:hypothetical protein
MKTENQQRRTIRSHLSLCLKASTIFLLLLLSALVIACGAGNTPTTADLNDPQGSVSIRFNTNASIPTVAPYLCGAWITNTTPAFKPGDKIPVYAHFIHNVNGNPVGVSGASAQASVEWADGYRDSEVVMTAQDGLAVFYFTIPNRPDMLNKNNLVLVSFTGPNGESCNVDNQPQPAAFFTFTNGKGSSTPGASPGNSPPKRHKKG